MVFVEHDQALHQQADQGEHHHELEVTEEPPDRPLVFVKMAEALDTPLRREAEIWEASSKVLSLPVWRPKGRVTTW